MQGFPGGGYREHYRVEEVVQEDFTLKDDYHHTSGGMHMKPGGHWSSQPKHGYSSHNGHGYDTYNDSLKDGHNGYRAQISEDCYENGGYNGPWNGRNNYSSHGAHKYQSDVPHGAAGYAGYGGHHGGQGQGQGQHQHQPVHHRDGEKPFWNSRAITD